MSTKEIMTKNEFNDHPVIMVMNQIANFHLSMAQLFDSQSSKVKRIRDAENFYKLSKHESKFYNNSLLALKAITHQANESSLRESTFECAMKSDRILGKLARTNQKITIMTQDADGTTDITQVYETLCDGHRDCLAVCNAYLEALPDAQANVILSELIDCYRH